MKAPVRQYGRETGQPPSQSQGPLSHHETYTLQSQVPRANFPRLLLGCLTQPVSWCLSQNSKQCQPLFSVAALQPQTGRGNILSLHLGSGRLGERERDGIDYRDTWHFPTQYVQTCCSFSVFVSKFCVQILKMCLKNIWCFQALESCFIGLNCWIYICLYLELV